MNNLTRQQVNTPAGITTAQIFNIGLSRLIGDIVVTAFSIYLWLQSGAWQLGYLTIGLVTMIPIGIIGLRLIRGQRPLLGIWLNLSLIWPATLLATTLIAEVSLPLGVIALILTLFSAGQALPQKQVNWAMAIAVCFFILTIWVDRLSPAYRLPVPPLFLMGIFTVATVLTLVQGYFVIRDFTSFSLRTKLVVAFLLVTLGSLGALAYLNIRSTRAALLDNTNRSLLTAAHQTATSIDTFIKTNLDDIEVEAQLPVWTKYLALPEGQRDQSSPEGFEALSTLLALNHRDPVHISSYALLDIQGHNLLDTLRSDTGKDESAQVYVKTVLETQQSYVSPVIFAETTESPFIYFSSPIEDAEGNIIGILRLRYSGIILQQLITRSSNFLFGSDDAFAILLDENQIRLADGVDAKELFKTLTPLTPVLISQLQVEQRLPNRPVEELSTNLPAFAQGIANSATQPAFVAATHPGDISQNQLNQVAVARLNNQPWQVVVAQSSASFEAPIRTQIQNSFFYTVMIGIVVGIGAFGLGHYLAGPIIRLTAVAQRISGGDVEAQAAIEAQDETGQLAETFNKMTAQLRHLIGSLEDQVQARTAELTLSMEVGQRAAAIKEVDKLLPTITEFIRQQFDLYYTQVYFVDDLGQNLVLQAGTGHVGKELLARHHSLPIGQGSIVGRVASEGQAVIVSDTITSDIHKPNSLLPETRSELAVPLVVEEQVVGVLDMQAKQPNAFTRENQTVFEAMGIQLANAIDSARQWALAQEARRRSEQALNQLTRETWAETLATRRGGLAFSYDLSAVTPLTSAQQNGGVVVPVVVQNQTIGQLSVRPPEGKVLSADEHALLSAVSQQLAQKAENIRLFEETQQRATREQIARQIADKIRASRDIEMALKTAAAELSKALGTAKAVVSLQITNPEDQAKTDE